MAGLSLSEGLPASGGSLDLRGWPAATRTRCTGLKQMAPMSAAVFMAEYNYYYVYLSEDIVIRVKTL